MVQDQKTLGENITMTHLVHFDKKYPITELDIVFCVEVKDDPVEKTENKICSFSVHFQIHYATMAACYDRILNKKALLASSP